MALEDLNAAPTNPAEGSAIKTEATPTAEALAATAAKFEVGVSVTGGIDEAGTAELSEVQARLGIAKEEKKGPTLMTGAYEIALDAATGDFTTAEKMAIEALAKEGLTNPKASGDDQATWAYEDTLRKKTFEIRGDALESIKGTNEGAQRLLAGEYFVKTIDTDPKQLQNVLSLVNELQGSVFATRLQELLTNNGYIQPAVTQQ